ncbi:MAG: class II aldolase [Clostridia bacterium]|nr:class II aldolase [Clostridia bacterium]MBQ4157538.1 class II aldolase [Clostridia bacterium]
MNLSPLIYFSRLYGANQDLVTCGGGNTSMKEDGVMYVKGSGTALKDAVTETFVGMNHTKLMNMLDDVYPEGDVEREAKFLKDVTDAKLPGEESKRPSVEALLHALFPQKFVLHLHPSLVNGLTCSVNGEAECARLFGDSVVWVPECKPGYVLARKMKDIFDASEKKIKTVLLENHGVFFAADTVEGLATSLNGMMNALTSQVKDFPDVESQAEDPGYGEKIKAVSGKQFVRFNASPAALKFAESVSAAKPIMKPFNPDQIVYCGPKVQFANCENCLNEITANVIIMKGVGIYAIGDTEKNANNCMTLVKDAMKVATYAKAFGGEKPMNEELVNFIVNWEVESYRKSVK